MNQLQELNLSEENHLENLCLFDITQKVVVSSQFDLTTFPKLELFVKVFEVFDALWVLSSPELIFLLLFDLLQFVHFHALFFLYDSILNPSDPFDPFAC